MKTLAGIDGNKVRDTVFLSSDGKKVLTPKESTVTSTIGKAELTVTYKVGTKLKAIRQALDRSGCYSPEEAVHHILSGEEVADREDPNRTSDAFMFAEPELDEKMVTPLDVEEKLNRYAWFVEICNRVADQEVLSYILENAPKKKNGTFAKNRLTVVAAMPVVFGTYMSYYEIVGKAKNDCFLELSVQERTFSEDEWVKTKDNIFLSFLENGNKEGDLPRTKVKISHKRRDTKTTIEIPAVRLSNGKLAIDAMPYRPISEFACVAGDDKKGYEILEPKAPDISFVWANGHKENVHWDIPSTRGIWVIWAYLDEPAKYIRTGKKAYLQRAEIYMANRGEKIPERNLTEHYIAEITYQLLCTMDGIYQSLQDPTLQQKIADAAKRKANGELAKYGNGSIQTPYAPGREIPLVSGALFLQNESEDTIRIGYELSHQRGDSWSEYSANG